MLAWPHPGKGKHWVILYLGLYKKFSVVWRFLDLCLLLTWYLLFISQISKSHWIHSRLSERKVLERMLEPEDALEISHLVWPPIYPWRCWPRKINDWTKIIQLSHGKSETRSCSDFSTVFHCFLNYTLTWSAFPFLELWLKPPSSRWIRQSHSCVYIFLQVLFHIATFKP